MLFHAELLFTDTDSLTYETKSKDVLFDFSNYPEDSKFFDETNKKIVDKIKDEFGRVIVD